MGILIRRKHENFVYTGMVKLAIIFFIVSLAASLIDTIWAVYLNGFLHNASSVGFFSSFLSLLAFVSAFMLVPFIEKSNKPVLYSICLLLSAVFNVIFAINKNFLVFVLIAILITLVSVVRIITRGIIVKDGSKKKSLSKSEGIVFSVNNVAWVIGPLIAGFVLVEVGIPYVFSLSAILVLIGFLLFRMTNVKNPKNNKKFDGNAMKNFVDYFRNKDRVIIYMMTMGISFWWVLIYLYIPLFIIEKGLNKGLIGIFLFLVAIPLILSEYPLSKIAGKRGAKALFSIAYGSLIAICLIIFFVKSFYLILGLLVLASFSLAMLEPTTEAYFFDITSKDGNENKFYGPYNTSLEIGFILGKVIPAIILIFLPFNYIFLAFALFFLFLFFLSFKARKIIEDGKS